MAELEPDDYTLPDGKVLYFERGTPLAEVEKYVNENHAESMIVKAPVSPEDEFSPNPGAATRFGHAFSGGFDHGIDKILPGAAAATAVANVDEEAWQAAQAGLAKETDDTHRANPNAPSFAEVREKYNKIGIWSALGEMVDLTAHAAGSSLGESAVPVGAMAAGALAVTTAPVTGVALTAAGLGVMYSQFVADNMERAYAEGTATVEEVDLYKTLLAAAAQTGMERFSLGASRVVPFGKVSTALRAAVDAGSPVLRDAANRSAVLAAKQVFSERLGSGAAAFLKATAAETSTEIGQEVFERYAANEQMIPDLDDDEALNEFLEVAVQSALGSLPFSSYAGSHGYNQQNALHKKQMGVIENSALDEDYIFESKKRAQARKETDALESLARTTQVYDELNAEALEDLKHVAFEEEERASGQIAGIRGIDRTESDISNVARDRNIDISSTPAAIAGFQRLVYQTINTHNLGKASAAQIDQVYTKIASLDPNESIAPLPSSTTSESVIIGEEIEAGKDKEFTKVQLKRKIMDILEKNKEKRSKPGEGGPFAGDKHLSIRSDSIINRMIDRGMLLSNPRVRNKKGQGRAKKSGQTYRIEVGSLKTLGDPVLNDIATQTVQAARESVQIKQDSQGNDIEIVGQYPSHDAVNALVGTIPKDVYNKVRESLHKRGILRKENKQYFYADVPEILTNRREFERSKKPVMKWIVRDDKGQVFYIANTKADAKSLRTDGAEMGYKLRPEEREGGYVVRESEFSNIEDAKPKLLRSMPVEFVADEAGADMVADQRVEALRSLHEQARSEYLGTAGEQIGSDLDPDMARLARSELKANQDKATELARRDPYSAEAVINRYHLGLEEDSAARNDLDYMDQARQWHIPADILSNEGKSIRVKVKRGTFDPDTGRGFGKARMDAQSPGWLGRLIEIMDVIKGFEAQGAIGNKKYGATAFGPSGRFGMFAEGSGRTIISDGHGADAQYYVFDYLEENGEPTFHLYNQFNAEADYSDMVEDMAPRKGHAQHRGNPTPESVNAAENPDKDWVRRLSPAEREAELIGPEGSIEANAAANMEATPRQPPKSLFNRVNDMINRYWSDGVMARLRVRFVDSKDRIVVREGQIMDQNGDPLTAELSAVAAARAYARIADMTWESLTNGYIEAVSITNAEGVDQGAQILVAREHTLTNETKPMMVYNKIEGKFETKTYSADTHAESRGNVNGGILTVLQSLNPAELDRMHKYRSAVRVTNMRLEHAAKGDGKPALVPLTQEQAQTYLGYLDEGESGARIAVAVQNLNDLNEKTVDYLKKTQILSEEDAAKWLMHSDYISFYRDFEEPGNQKYKQKHQNERIQAGIPNTLLGDLTYQGKHKEWSGFTVEEKFSDEVIDQTEAMLYNLVTAYTAGSVNVARSRAIRNEVTLNAARLVADEDVSGAIANGDSVLRVRVKGKDVHYSVDDMQMFETLEGEWGDTLAEWVRNHPYLRWVTQWPTQLLRETVTRDPSFALPNLIRDAMAVYFVNGGHPADILSSVNRAGQNIMADMKGKDVHLSSRVLALHGITSGIDQVSSHRGPSAIVEDLRDRISGKKHGKVKSGLTMAWDHAGRWSAMSESATRELVYEHTQLIEKERLGKSGKYSARDIDILAKNEGMFQAKEILNFSTRGKSQALSLFTQTVPFINAMIQGTDVIARGTFGYRRAGYDNRVDIETRTRGIVRRAAMIAVASAMLELLNIDDDEYESHSQYKRDNNWFFPIAGTDGAFFTIPAPHGISFFVKNLPQLVVRDVINVFNGDTSRAGRETFASLMAFAQGPSSGGALVPTMLKSPYEWAANKTLWGGIPIDKFWQESLPAGERYDEDTTAQARLIGKMGVSPQKVDATIETMTGGLGAFVWGTLDAILRAPAGLWDGWPVPVKPMIEFRDIPVIKRLATTQPGNQYSMEYYELRKVINEYAARIRNSVTPQEEAIVKREYRHLRLAGKQLAATDKKMRQLRAEERTARANPGNRYSSFELGRLLDDIRDRRNKTLKTVPAIRRRLDRSQ